MLQVHLHIWLPHILAPMQPSAPKRMHGQSIFDMGHLQPYAGVHTRGGPNILLVTEAKGVMHLGKKMPDFFHLKLEIISWREVELNQSIIDWS